MHGPSDPHGRRQHLQYAASTCLTGRVRAFVGDEAIRNARLNWGRGGGGKDKVVTDLCLSLQLSFYGNTELN